jgi:hypothetical protein
MRKRKLAVFAGVLAVAAGFAASSGAGSGIGTPDTLPNGDPGVSTGSYTDTLYDANGNVVATKSGVVAGGTVFSSPWGSADTTNAATATQTDVTSHDGTSDYSSGSSGGAPTSMAPAPGCMDHTVTAEQDSLLGFILFQYKVKSHWCWNSSWGITVMHTGISWDNVDATFKVDANCAGNDAQSCYGWFYSWHGNPKGGHYTSRQGDIEQDICIPFIGCYTVGHCYPRVQTWVNAGPWYTGKPEAGC